MLLHELTMPEFDAHRKKIRSAILPIGVVEQHGPHLPLGLDAMHAQELALAASAIKPCFVMPPLYYGITRSTAKHPGTLGISGDTLRSILHDIGAVIHSQGTECLCLLTGHAGGTHQCAMVEAGERLLESTGLEVAVVCVLDLLDGAKDFLECAGDSHAGEVETSLALHLWPDLVKGSAPEEYPTIPKFRLIRDKVAHWPGGVWGDPAKASAEKGRRILEIEAKALVEVVADLERAADAAKA